MAAHLTANGGPVYVRVLAGFMNQIGYDLYLRDKGTGASTIIVQRHTENPGTYLAATQGAGLANHSLLYGVDVRSPSNDPNQMYSVSISVMQGGRIVPGGQEDEQDKFDGATVVTGVIDLVLA